MTKDLAKLAKDLSELTEGRDYLVTEAFMDAIDA